MDNQNPTAPVADPNQGGMPAGDAPMTPPAPEPTPAPEAPVEQPAEAPASPEAPAEAPTEQGGGNSGTPVGGM